MKPLNLQFLPLTFIDSAEKIKEQIINTAVFASLLEGHSRTNLKYYLESTQYGYTASSSEQGDYKFLRITDINHGAVEWNNVPFCSGSGVDKYLLKSNDILVARTGGTTGKSHLVTNPPNNAVFASYLIRLRPEPHTNPFFIDAFLNSYLFWNQVVAMKSGSAQPNVNAEKLKELILPKCDLTTQNRVVGFIKNPETMDAALKHRVLRVIEKYDTLNGLLSTTDSQLGVIPQLRQSLLREAMQGQLLPQDPTDEPAALLLQKLQAAKAATGKGRKGKAGVLFAGEAELKEGPFDIPATWAWGQLKDLVENYGQKVPDKDFVYIDVSSIDSARGVVSRDALVLKPEQAPSRARKIVREGCVIYSTIRPYLLNVALIEEKFSHEAIASTAFAVMNPSAAVFNKYLYYYLRSPQFIRFVEEKQKGQAYPAINDENLYNGLIALPPLVEQHRIVAKLEQLMQHCDALEQRIRESRRLAEQLLATALREALAPPAGLEEAEEELELAEVAEVPAAVSRRGRGRPPKSDFQPGDQMSLGGLFA